MKVSNVLEQRIGDLKGEVFDAFKGDPCDRPNPEKVCQRRTAFGLDDLLGKPSGAMTRVVAS
ncbi:MAG: hypothetical protein AB8B60_20980 [Sulfitobacter sp.]